MDLTDYPNMGQIRIYNIEAISLPIEYNKFGDHDPNGLMYVLKKDSERIQKIARELFELPVPPILKAYVGDPSKIRLIDEGVKETHIFHLHNHQWRLEPDDPKSTTIDSISISPQECHTLDILYGAGSFNGMIGDAIFHCNLYPHFHEGMWTLWRIFDRLKDGDLSRWNSHQCTDAA